MRTVLLSYRAVVHCSQIPPWPEFCSFINSSECEQGSIRKCVFFQHPNFANENEAPEGEETCLKSHS